MDLKEFQKSRPMRIKIYRFFDGVARESAYGLLNLNFPPKVTQCWDVTGKAERLPDEVREYVELILKNDLLPGRRGLEGTLEFYKPPVKAPVVRINGASYAWTIEEPPAETDQDKVQNSPYKKPNIMRAKPGKRKKILVIDDEPDIVKGLRIRLRGNGYDVVSAPDPIQGVSVIRKEEPDLIILDIRMPAGGGFTVAERRKHFTHSRAIPIIILTGSADKTHEAKAKELGIRYFMKKPYDPEELLGAVSEALDSPLTLDS
jgi:CheY-like chemotaxis protein